jgi:molybdopterin-biosynthesis enzyme MoeA-like protein
LRAAASEADAVIAAGGLGPTVDDPTRAAAALAAGTKLVFHKELWETIKARFHRSGRIPSKNNRRQAFLPRGAEALPNPIGTAPGFSMRLKNAVLYAVPGVPSEMGAMVADQVLPALHKQAGRRQTIRTRTLHVADLGESQVDERIGRWERKANPTVGLTADAGVTHVRIAARAARDSAAEEKIRAAEKDIRSALADNIFGAGDETLAGAVLRLLPEGGSLATAESGTGGALAGMLECESGAGYRGGLVPGRTEAETGIEGPLRDWMLRRHATHALGLMLTAVPGGYRSEYLFLSPAGEIRKSRLHLVPHGLAARWAAQTALAAAWNELRKPRG